MYPFRRQKTTQILSYKSIQLTLYISLSVSQLLLYKGVLNISLPLICYACKGIEVRKEAT